MSVTSVNQLVLATSMPYANYLSSIPSTPSDPNALTFLAYDPAFYDITGSCPTSRLLGAHTDQFTHEAGIYAPETNSVYISSNYLTYDNPVNVTILSLDDFTTREVNYPGLVFANGGCPYPSNSASNATQLLWCAEGSFTSPSALVLLDPVTGTTTPLLTSFHGLPFASINDAEIHAPTGDVYFTDAPYGFFQAFRPAPTLPFQAYRFRPSTGAVEVIANDAFINNGIEFSPDYMRLYITDTSTRMKNPANATFPTYYPTRPVIYVYDLSTNATGQVPVLSNRRLFAYSDNGFPDGIHTDAQGNVYAACGDGIQVWNPQGTLLGKIVVPLTPEQAAQGYATTVNNFAFVKGGMVLFNNRRLWYAGIQAVGRQFVEEPSG